MVDRINAPGSGFAGSNATYGSPTSPVLRSFAKRVPQEAPVGSLEPAKPTILTRFGDYIPPTEEPVERTALTGPYSLVRSVRTSEQHATLFWDALGVLGSEALNGEATADPSPAALEQSWEDFQLISYLPPQLMPTREGFIKASTPSQRKSWLLDHLVDMGIVLVAASRTEALNPLDTAGSSATDVLIAAQTPFRATVLQCRNQFFTAGVGG